MAKIGYSLGSFTYIIRLLLESYCSDRQAISQIFLQMAVAILLVLDNEIETKLITYATARLVHKHLSHSSSLCSVPHSAGWKEDNPRVIGQTSINLDSGVS